MKTLIFYLVLLLVGTSQAQEITELKEAKVGFSSLLSNVQQSGNSFTFKVKEKHAGSFEKDPLAFMQENFDIKEFAKQHQREDYDSYNVSFKSRKGILTADFNRDGDLVRSNSRFQNIVLPEKLRSQLYRDHKGWTMTKNSHITNVLKGVVQRDYYKIKLENGKEKMRITLAAPIEGATVAGN